MVRNILDGNAGARGGVARAGAEPSGEAFVVVAGVVAIGGFSLPPLPLLSSPSRLCAGFADFVYRGRWFVKPWISCAPTARLGVSTMAPTFCLVSRCIWRPFLCKSAMTLMYHAE